MGKLVGYNTDEAMMSILYLFKTSDKNSADSLIYNIYLYRKLIVLGSIATVYGTRGLRLRSTVVCIMQPSTILFICINSRNKFTVVLQC